MTRHHDTGYKELFSYPEFVQQLMEGFVPPEISNLLDYTTLKSHPGHYITPLFNEKLEDAVWSIQLKAQADQPGITVYLYILMEFQSSVDATMPLRMLHYVASFYHQLLKARKINLKDGLPPVFPIVLYNGDPVWKVPGDMQQLIQKVPIFLKKYQPQLHYYLLDEKRLDQQLLEQSSSPLSRIFGVEQAETETTVQQAFERLFQSIRNHPDKERIYKVLERWIRFYLHHNAIRINLESLNSLEELPDMLAENIKKERLEWKRQWLQEGMQQGVQQGYQQAQAEAVLKMLHRGMSEAEIADLLELSLQQIQDIKASHRH